MTKGRVLWFGGLAALLGLVADQGSKWALIDFMARHDNQPVDVLPVLDLVMWWNHGTSFSLFHINSAWGAI